MRIAHFIATNFFGGPEKQILEHARRMGRSGLQVVLVSYLEGKGGNELIERAEGEGIAARIMPSRSALSPASVLDLIKVLKKDSIEVLCTHGYKPDLIGRLASWAAGVPMIAVSRGWTGENGKVRLYEGLDKKVLRLADHIIPVSGGQKEKIKRLGVREEKLTVIYNGVELDGARSPSGALKKEFGLSPETALIISAGRLSPEKNFAGLVQAARTVVGRADAAFIVFGDGPLRKELENKASEAGLGGRFLFPGFRKDVSALFAEADVFALPSFTEGLPNVVLEAYACKRPVVATAVGGTPEVVRDGVTGFLVKPEESGLMAERILELVVDEGLRIRMGEKGFERVKEIFSFDSQTEKYLEVYSAIRKAKHG